MMVSHAFGSVCVTCGPPGLSCVCRTIWGSLLTFTAERNGLRTRSSLSPKLGLSPSAMRSTGPTPVCTCSRDLALATRDQAEAERCLRRAMESAQAQSARALLLRGSAKLTRLVAEGDRRAEAYDELTKIYGSFTEGFETVDSREARAVLDGI
jgi:hypothetical protein